MPTWGCSALPSLMPFPGIVWSPLIFLGVFLVLFVLLWLYSRMWNLSYNKGMQREPFISGNEETPGVQLKGDGLCWGFFQALPGYYAKMREMHSQMVNDYIYWFVIVLAIVLVVVGVT